MSFLLGHQNSGALPDSTLIQALTSVRPVVAGNVCPRTYASMTVVVDSLGRRMDPPPPPGYVDPTRLTFGRPQFDGRDHAYIYVREEVGTGGRDFLCSAGGERGRVVRCQRISSWVH
ncbi:MAG: hypothetical protein IT353_15045 [Gemmatimonadaceae bacterium]|nr:hypothetical protein [Gemmatimonadaceae bacterium]